MSLTYGKFITIVGAILLLHSAYSAAQHRRILRLSEEEFEHLPLDIAVECLLGFAIVCIGIVNVAGDFRVIFAAAEPENKVWDNINRPSFYAFNHRARSLNRHAR